MNGETKAPEAARDALNATIAECAEQTAIPPTAPARTYRLWSQDYTQLLCESTDLQAVKRYFVNTELDWAGLTAESDSADNRWRNRWGGRITRGIDGVEVGQAFEYLRYLTQPPTFEPTPDPAPVVTEVYSRPITDGDRLLPIVDQPQQFPRDLAGFQFVGNIVGDGPELKHFAVDDE
jgi:hypothetical protein